MNNNNFLGNVRSLIQQRMYITSFALLMLVSNLMLCAKIYNTEDQFIVLPMNDPTDTFSFSRKTLTSNYIKKWANYLIFNMYNVNPQTVDENISVILLNSYASHGQLKKQLSIYKEKIKKEQLRTVFYPEIYDVSIKGACVNVRGKLLTFVGRSKKAIEQNKTFQISWKRYANGIIAINDIVEIKV